MKLHESFPIITDDLATVDRIIRQRLESEVALIGAIGEYIIGAGGKRLRPVLLLLVARAFGFGSTESTRQSEMHCLLATVVEFIHTATLLHDDVVDESTLRRGRATANAEFGNASAVLVGDFLYSRSFQMMCECGNPRILKLLADATNTIAEGEVMQLLNVHDPDIAQDDYLRVIRYKTARLFEAAAQIGAVLAGATPQQEQASAAYGQHLGTAFQLIDDVLDYSGQAGQMGKNIGDDLREGKPTLPLIRVMQVGTPADRDLVRASISNGGQDSDFPAIHAAIERSGALDYTRAAAQAEAEAARCAARMLPPSDHRDALLYLADYSVSRTT